MFSLFSLYSLCFLEQKTVFKNCKHTGPMVFMYYNLVKGSLVLEFRRYFYVVILYANFVF